MMLDIVKNPKVKVCSMCAERITKKNKVKNWLCRKCNEMLLREIAGSAVDYR